LSTLRFPRGSEWRRWDLQIHTPYSALNNGFGDDFQTFGKRLFEKALAANIAVIGVTDYFSIDGYKALSALRRDTRFRALLGPDTASKADAILLLPNVEFRTSVIVRQANGKDSRVNFHVIFSDYLDARTIEEHFLRELKFTAESSPGNRDELWSLTPMNLETLGKALKEQHKHFRDKSDLYVGMMTAVINHEHVTDVLFRQTSRFGDRFLVLVPADEDLSECGWHGQGHLARKLLIQKSHMLFSGNPGTRAFGLGLKHETINAFREEFKTLKPCVHGSDAHSYDNLFEPAERRFLWVKADPTFHGLQQLLHEPAARVHIGETHPSLARENQHATKYIRGLQFQRTQKAKPNEVWFSGEVSFNFGLVAIICNKGGGKSALADILGLLSNVRNSQDFSFLTKQRFLEPKASLGAMFTGSLLWHSGLETSRLLSETADNTAPELTKYIPQNYLENICSELKASRESRFDNELMEVIFSHVSEADRLGKETLRELIDYLTREKEEQIARMAMEVSAVNEIIVAREELLAPAHRKSLEAQLSQRRAELKAHDESKPVEVIEPSKNLEQQDVMAPVKADLASLVSQWEQIDLEIDKAQRTAKEVALRIAAADRLLKRLDNLERQVVAFHADSLSDGTALGLNTAALVELKVNRTPILDVKDEAEALGRTLRASLDEGVVGSLPQRRLELSKKTEDTRRRLDEPNRRYQEYLHRLAEWQKRRLIIEGSESEPQSIRGLEGKLAALDRLPLEILENKNTRDELVQAMFGSKQELLADYQRLYHPVQKFIETHPVSQQQKALQFSAAIVVDGFEENFLAMIHQGRRGSFQGEEEGRARLREVLASSDFSTLEGVKSFLRNVQDHLDIDKREESGKAMLTAEQLRRGCSPKDVYDLVYGLSYLKPRFELRWQDKPLDQLSPGERGNLLLVFYLLIDKRDVPLIIDQPEENLDNETIATMLVPAIKHAKDRRQVILVTHNPNLAVVCDADQIIHARLEKSDGNRVTYTSGAIEEPVMNQLIVDVLEGTKPAFDLRDAKYGILERGPFAG
jgi:hypothetical protein